jgi:3-oxoacyl-[acyl-carrier-protein] synthase-3
MHHYSSLVAIAGTGSFTPQSVVTNAELAQRAPTNDRWVRENLGVHSRRRVEEGQLTSDLAVVASKNAMEMAGLAPNEIELIIVATATPDRSAPSTACLLQHKLGITNHSPAFDVSAVCSGFLYGMSIASQFLASGTFRNALVVGADSFSRITDYSRRDCVFFGDGAGAVIMTRLAQDDDGFFSCEIFADGRGQDNFTVLPGDRFFTMDGGAVFRTATEVLPAAITSLLARHKLNPRDIAHLIPHQASIRVLQKTAEMLHLPLDRVRMNMSEYANTAGATVPLLLDQTVRAGMISEGDLLAFAAVGSGWTWGAALYRWRPIVNAGTLTRSFVQT